LLFKIITGCKGRT